MDLVPLCIKEYAEQPTLLSFSLLRSAIVCLQGSGTHTIDQSSTELTSCSRLAAKIPHHKFCIVILYYYNVKKKQQFGVNNYYIIIIIYIITTVIYYIIIIIIIIIYITYYIYN